MIEWIPFDLDNPPKANMWYFVILDKEGPVPWCAFYGHSFGEGNVWKVDVFSKYRLKNVTHYAEINYPTS